MGRTNINITFCKVTHWPLIRMIFFWYCKHLLDVATNLEKLKLHMSFIIKYLSCFTSIKVLKNDHYHKYQNVNWLFLLENKPWMPWTQLWMDPWFKCQDFCNLFTSWVFVCKLFIACTKTIKLTTIINKINFNKHLRKGGCMKCT